MFWLSNLKEFIKRNNNSISTLIKNINNNNYLINYSFIIINPKNSHYSLANIEVHFDVKILNSRELLLTIPMQCSLTYPPNEDYVSFHSRVRFIMKEKLSYMVPSFFEEHLDEILNYIFKNIDFDKFTIKLYNDIVNIISSKKFHEDFLNIKNQILEYYLKVMKISFGIQEKQIIQLIILK